MEAEGASWLRLQDEACILPDALMEKAAAFIKEDVPQA